MYLLYSFLLAAAALISSPWWIFQMLRLGKYRRGLRERLGFVPPRLEKSVRGAIWIHAVSVGEVLAVTQLVAEFKKEFPQRAIFLSTTTAAGQQLARQRFGEARVFYIPLDFKFALRPYFRALRPSLVVLAETEFWPNLLHLAKRRGASLAIVNARISDRSYPRYKRFRWFFRPVLSHPDLFLAQTEQDARRLCDIGAPAERVKTSGNLKFDIRLSSRIPLVDDLRRAIANNSPVLVCGSTAEGEEELLLGVLRQVLERWPTAVMILAPRHPERFEKVANLVLASGIGLLRRSTWAAACPISGGVFLLDSVGELAPVYQLADVAFVGGSLAPVGGHNILEPAQHGIAIVTGPHTFNFREIVRIFSEAGALRVVTDQDLATQFLDLLADERARNSLGQRAKQVFLENAGATERTVAAVSELLHRVESSGA
ncbi:MAG TPA: 3-deoxy-D-manno-octulosonic acid transferase [Terriglobales bacterium]|nr:3-deoxy-D-manno-octulosonic acid transferase [Terriglobales bacterium]